MDRNCVLIIPEFIVYKLPRKVKKFYKGLFVDSAKQLGICNKAIKRTIKFARNEYKKQEITNGFTFCNHDWRCMDSIENSATKYYCWKCGRTSF